MACGHVEMLRAVNKKRRQIYIKPVSHNLFLIYPVILSHAQPLNMAAGHLNPSTI